MKSNEGSKCKLDFGTAAFDDGERRKVDLATAPLNVIIPKPQIDRLILVEVITDLKQITHRNNLRILRQNPGRHHHRQQHSLFHHHHPFAWCSGSWQHCCKSSCRAARSCNCTILEFKSYVHASSTSESGRNPGTSFTLEFFVLTETSMQHRGNYNRKSGTCCCDAGWCATSSRFDGDDDANV